MPYLIPECQLAPVFMVSLMHELLFHSFAVYDNNTFPTLREVFGRPDAAAYIKVIIP